MHLIPAGESILPRLASPRPPLHPLLPLFSFALPPLCSVRSPRASSRFRPVVSPLRAVDSMRVRPCNLDIERFLPAASLPASRRPCRPFLSLSLSLSLSPSPSLSLSSFLSRLHRHRRRTSVADVRVIRPASLNNKKKEEKKGERERERRRGRRIKWNNRIAPVALRRSLLSGDRVADAPLTRNLYPQPRHPHATRAGSSVLFKVAAPQKRCAIDLARSTQFRHDGSGKLSSPRFFSLGQFLSDDRECVSR